MMDHLYGTSYGVVRGTNELINDSNRLKVVGFGLNPADVLRSRRQGCGVGGI